MGLLQDELRMSRPFGSPRLEAFLGLVRTTDRLVRLGEAILAPYGLGTTQYNILRILRGAGDAGLPVGAIGERLVTREPDVTRLIDRLERRELVTRSRSATDRRVVLVRLSGSGRSLVDSIPMDEAMDQVLAPHFAGLSADDLRLFITLCDRIRSAPNQG
jgi:DNA-binding MarR family transcriptional regulator